MIHVLLTSELPWQQNGAITFSCLCISRFYKVFFFVCFALFFFFSEIALGSLYLPWLPRLVAKFEQIL